MNTRLLGNPRPAGSATAAGVPFPTPDEEPPTFPTA
jgi:hypothetical protein